MKIAGSDRIAYLHLWPHARRWRFSKPEPMLRCIPDPVHVAEGVADDVGVAYGPHRLEDQLPGGQSQRQLAGSLVLVLLVVLVPGGRRPFPRVLTVHDGEDVSVATREAVVGTDLQRLTDEPAYDAEATVSTDGKWIVFDAARGTTYQLYRVRRDGGTIETLAELDGNLAGWSMRGGTPMSSRT